MSQEKWFVIETWDMNLESPYQRTLTITEQKPPVNNYDIEGGMYQKDNITIILRDTFDSKEKAMEYIKLKLPHGKDIENGRLDNREYNFISTFIDYLKLNYSNYERLRLYKGISDEKIKEINDQIIFSADEDMVFLLNSDDITSYLKKIVKTLETDT